jgi:ubiquinone/menaquinone biosynthesis C-methylase UbiE
MNIPLEQIYDEFAETYEANRGRFDMTEVCRSFFTRLPEKKGRLLDLGCGAGEPFARWFIDQGWSVTGVDFSARMLALAAKYVPEMKTIHADMRQAEFEPDSFDAITAIYSLFHVPSDEHSALFAKFYRWLRPQGKILFTYAGREYTGCEEFDGCKEFMGRQLYYSHKRPETLRAMLAQAGFHVESEACRCLGGESFLWVQAGKAT